MKPLKFVVGQAKRDREYSVSQGMGVADPLGST